MKYIFMVFIVGVAALICTAKVKAQTAGTTNVMNKGVRCDGMTDGAMVFNAAKRSGQIVIASESCQISSNVTFNGNVVFLPGASIVTAGGVTVTINGKVTAAKDAQIFDGPGSVVVNAPWVSVAWWGALASGADAALGFQAAMGSNRVVYVPPGSYTFKSNQSVPVPANDPAGVLVQNVSNLSIEGYGATITMADAVSFSEDFLFFKVKNLNIQGLTFAGNRAGLTSSDENAALGLESIVNFSIADIKLTGNWGGIGTAVAADWLVNGTFRNFNMSAVGQCFDVAFLKNVSFENFQATGADTNGNQGAGQVGLKCVSVIFDTPLVDFNETGVSYSDTDGVVVTGGAVTNFATGALAASGQNYFFSGNDWYSNPGLLPGSTGIGILVFYFNGGSSSSVGHPPGNITVDGDKFLNNGGAVVGAGFFIGNSGITNSDVISGITIVNSTFDNNINTGITANSTSHLANVVLCRNFFEGLNQSFAIGGDLIGLVQNCPVRQSTH